MNLLVEISSCKVHPSFTLTNIHLQAKRGEIIGVVGPNGCGKSTLCHVLSGHYSSRGVSIVWDGTEISNLPPSKRPFSLKFQVPALFADFTVLRNVLLGPHIAGRAKEAKKEAERILKALALDTLINRKASKLSGGERQRVELARTLLDGRPILLLDEPFSGVDAQARSLAQELLMSEVKNRDLVALLITHEIDTLSALASKCIVLKDGNMISEKNPRQLLTSPESLFEARLAGYRNIIHLRDSTLGNFLGHKLQHVLQKENFYINETFAVIPDDALSLFYDAEKTIDKLDGKVVGHLSGHSTEEVILLIHGERVIMSLPRDSKYTFSIGDNIGIGINCERIKLVKTS